MHGAPFNFLAEIGIPTAGQCLAFVGPILAVAAVWWIINRTDQIIERLFPHWEWERKMGWLNIRAQQQAEMFFRWIGYFVYALLAVSLYGIVWGAEAVPLLNQLDDPKVMAELVVHFPVLLISIGFWLIYLGCGLIPKLRDQHEAEQLEKFREEQRKIEAESETNAALRRKSWRSNSTLRSNRMGPK